MQCDKQVKVIHMNRRKKISRRNFLIGAGIIGTGTAGCICAGTAIAGIAWLSQLSSPELATPVPASPIPTQAPRFPMPPVVSRASWGALPPDHTARNENGFYSDDNIEGWRIYEEEIDAIYQTVIIHHSAFYEENDVNTVLEVQSTHRNQRGWADVGYHFMVGQNGLIYEGRDRAVRGTHVETFNTGSLGICLLGNFMTQAPTVEQLNSTLALVNWASERLNLSHIASHRHFNSQTQCPGDNLFPYIEQFASASGLAIGTEGYIPPTESASCFCCACHYSFA